MYAGTSFDCEMRGALVLESDTRIAIVDIMMSFFPKRDILKGILLPKAIISCIRDVQNDFLSF